MSGRRGVRGPAGRAQRAGISSPVTMRRNSGSTVACSRSRGAGRGVRGGPRGSGDRGARVRASVRHPVLFAREQCTV